MDKVTLLAALERVKSAMEEIVEQISESLSLIETAALTDRLNDIDNGRLVLEQMLERAGNSQAI